MMEKIGLILAVATVTYATRIAGFSLNRQLIPARLERALAYVPIAAFAALIVPGLSHEGSLDISRIAAAALAAAVVLLTRQLWVALAAGMAAFWIL